MGKLLMGTGLLLGAIVWLITGYSLFETGQPVLAMIGLLVPPADLILAFVVSPTLGVAAIGAITVFAIGAMVEGANDDVSL